MEGVAAQRFFLQGSSFRIVVCGSTRISPRLLGNVWPLLRISPISLSVNTLYSGKITSNLVNYNPSKYLGLSEPEWKKRFYNHTHSFNDRDYAKCEIAKEVWRIKDQGGNYQIRWEIVGHAPGYNPITRKCRLCTAEKLLIAEDPDPRLLNKRDELVSKCRHRRKFALELFC